MPESESSRGGKRIRAGPFAYVSDGLHKVDLLLSSTHQVLLQRLKEGGIAIEQRRGKLFREGPQKRRETRSEQITTSAGPRRGFRRLSLPRDAEYAASEPRNVSAEMNGPSPSGRNGGALGPVALKVPHIPPIFAAKASGGGQPFQRSKRAWQQTLENCQENWALLALNVQRWLPKLGPPKLPKLSKARFTFVALPGSKTPGGEPVKPELALSLEEILKPFAGLSQLLNFHDLTTLDDLNNLIHKAAEELEAMREDKLNDGRRLGPLQKEALRRKKQRLQQIRSSLREPGRHVAIYTTASLPWMTGTAVNPLLRAAYLSKDKKRKVTLVIPWLAKTDQEVIFPHGVTFDSPEQQEEFVRNWVRQRTGFDCDFAVKFYPGRYATEKCSILPVGDPTAYIPDDEADVAVLEEPEHLNWYHHGRRWTDKFKHVVGVIHTNYLDYAMREEDGEAKAKALAIVNQLVCRMHCHKVVKLSDAVQPLPRQTTAFVHGVPDSFIRVGEAKARAAKETQQPAFDSGAYFIGKAIWAKGYTELLDLLDKHARRGEKQMHIDCYGSGEDLDAMKDFAKNRKLKVTFHGGRDHLDDSMHGYKVFVNPSTSDVVATTTAEALAMGKWVIVHDLPCNEFFSTFSNCLTYKTPEEFSQQLSFAMQHEPHPMKNEEAHRLTWEAATERFLDVSELRGEERASPMSAAIDTLAFNLHNYLTGLEALRAVSGAGVNTRDNPISLKDFVPSESPSGGFFDDKKRIQARAAKANAATPSS